MRFTNIRISVDEVSLDRVDKQPDGSLMTINLKNPAKPLSSFNAAMQAFSGFAVELIGAPDWHEDVKVTSLHLSEEPKTSRRGLIVTFTRRIERAKNRTVVVNTPLMHAPVDDQQGTNPGTFPAEVAEMIEIVEAEATRYWKGEREQAEMFPEGQAAGTSDDQPSKKPRKDRKAGTPGEVVNADKNVPPADEALRKLLYDAGRDVPIDAIATWGSQDRDRAQQWAAAQLRVKSGDLREEAAPKEPKVLLKFATPALIEA